MNLDGYNELSDQRNLFLDDISELHDTLDDGAIGTFFRVESIWSEI